MRYALRTHLPAIVLLALAVCANSSVSLAQETPCDASMVFVDTNDEMLQERVCQIVASAVPRLAECGLNLKSPVAIGFSKKLDNSSGVNSGIHNPGKKRIELPDPK